MNFPLTFFSKRGHSIKILLFVGWAMPTLPLILEILGSLDIANLYASDQSRRGFRGRKLL